MQPILTIDPGANGGVCLKTDKALRCYKMPASLLDKAALLTALRMKVQWGERFKVILEDVGFHIAGSNAQASAKFARHVGQLEGILAKLHVEIEYVRSVKWMGAFPNRPKSLVEHEKIILKAQYPSYSEKQFERLIADVNADRKARRKKYIKGKVSEAFPDVKLYTNLREKYSTKVTNWAADALGILLWAEKCRPKELME